MVERLFSDDKLEQLLSDWLQSSEGSYLTEDTPLILNSIQGGLSDIEIEDKQFKVSFSYSDGNITEIESKSQNPNVLIFLEECNLKFIQGEIKSMQKCLKFMMETYLKLVFSKSNNRQNYDQHEDDAQDWGVPDEKMDEEEEEMVDWNLDGGDQDVEMDTDYIQEIKDSVNQEKINEMKLLGITDQSAQISNVLNYKSIRLFEKTQFYSECFDALDYLKEHEQIIKGWLNLVILKEFLSIRVEIDLNYIDMNQSNCTLLGWKLEEPLIIILDISEPKILNTLEQDIPSLSFASMWNQGMIQFQCINAGVSTSYGCNDYMRQIFIKFVNEGLKKEYHPNQQEEEKKSDKQLSKNNKKGLWNKMFSNNSVDDEQLAQLVEMGFELDVAKRNLKKANNDIIKTLDLIREESIEGHYQNNDQAISFSSKYVPFTKNKVVRMMLYISDQLELATRSCFLCFEPLESESLKLRTCTRDQCEFTFEESFGGSIYTELKNNTVEASLNLTLAAKSLFSGRNTQVFEPFPTFFLKQYELRKKRGNLDEIKQAQISGIDVAKAKKTDEKNKDIEKMIQIFLKIPNPQKLLLEVSNEAQLRAKLNTFYTNEKDGFLAYKLLTYIFATNRQTIKKLRFEEQIIQDSEQFHQFIVINGDSTKERKFMQNKQKHGSIFCWHGSSLENWYSILRNGLRNLSNTTLMTAGAAYGQGIYASSQYTTSYGYTARYTSGSRSWMNADPQFSQSYCIAIVEIIKKNGYSKDPTHNIVVVPDEDDIIIRYLLVLANNQHSANPLITTQMKLEEHYQTQMKMINKQITTERKQRIEKAWLKYQERKEQQKQDQLKIQEQAYKKIQKADEEELEAQFKQMSSKLTGKGSVLSSQRIMKDYVGLCKSTEFKDKIKINFHNNNMYVWKVSFNLINYEISKELKNDFYDLLKLMHDDVEKTMLQYEIIFSDSYPHDPPFVRVVFPRFAFRTGHVTVGGSICIESLTPSGWSSARSLESYFVEVISLINAGDARLDLKNLIPYQLSEAKEAFNRVARDHGWL